MIFSIPKSNSSLIHNNRTYTIFSYERLIIPPFSKKHIQLPYFKKDIKENERFLSIELSKDLAFKGLQVLWHNLNEESSNNIFEFLLFNNNIDYEQIFNYRTSPLKQITGSALRIDILPNTLLGIIFIN